MGETIKQQGNELKGRWTAKMPRFFRQLTVLCACVAGTAFGINTMLTMAGAMTHEWWNDIYPLLIGVPTGMIIVCKLTVAGGYKDVDPDQLTRRNHILNKPASRRPDDAPEYAPDEEGSEEEPDDTPGEEDEEDNR